VERIEKARVGGENVKAQEELFTTLEKEKKGC
jgi:hypothetical protein